MLKKCECIGYGLVFKKYWFAKNRVAYRATCTECGLLRAWYDAKNYRIVTGNSLKRKEVMPYKRNGTDKKQ